MSCRVVQDDWLQLLARLAHLKPWNLHRETVGYLASLSSVLGREKKSSTVDKIEQRETSTDLGGDKLGLDAVQILQRPLADLRDQQHQQPQVDQVVHQHGLLQDRRRGSQHLPTAVFFFWKGTRAACVQRQWPKRVIEVR